MSVHKHEAITTQEAANGIRIPMYHNFTYKRYKALMVVVNVCLIRTIGRALLQRISSYMGDTGYKLQALSMIERYHFHSKTTITRHEHRRSTDIYTYTQK